jgi:hypothetical protein
MVSRHVDRLVSTVPWVSRTAKVYTQVQVLTFERLVDVHTQLENDIARFLGIDSVIVYSQSFSTITSVIPAFAKRGDVVVADKSVNFAIQKGLQIARCTVKWYEHNDMADLERQLKAVEKEAKRKGGSLKRRFIVSEGVFENNGAMLDLAKVVRCQYKPSRTNRFTNSLLLRSNSRKSTSFVSYWTKPIRLVWLASMEGG